jgi:hypothetical protein
MTSSVRRLLSGTVGALALTGIHQFGQRVRPHDAPRMDVVGMRALARSYRMAGAPPPQGETLYRRTLIGDLAANGVYYAAIPADSSWETWGRALVLGVAAGVGAYFLPRPMHLGDPPHSEQVSNAVMTVAWYVAGAVAAAACAELLRDKANATS